MNQHDFIFSNHYKPRLARHAAFVFCCWLFFCVTYYFPVQVFPGLNTEKFAGNVARIGLPKWLRLRFINSLLIFLPMLAFAYVVIYYILPQYLFDKRRKLMASIVAVGIFIVVLLTQYIGQWLVAINAFNAGPGRKMPDTKAIIVQSNTIMLLNYPIIVGFAVIVKMMKRGWMKQQENMQIIHEKASAELQLLKAQIHPHFLFNTLNNIYFLTLTASQKAPEMLTRLTDILRYILNECKESLVPLEKELKMIEDYIGLERVRYGDRLKMDFTVIGDYDGKMIPPLLLIPLVENSFKHGASKMLAHPWVNLTITVKEQFLYLFLSNSRPEEIIQPQRNSRIGLNNVKKRLHLLYPATYELNVTEGTHSFDVFMKVGIEEAGAIETITTPETTEYADA